MSTLKSYTEAIKGYMVCIKFFDNFGAMHQEVVRVNAKNDEQAMDLAELKFFAALVQYVDSGDPRRAPALEEVYVVERLGRDI